MQVNVTFYSYFKDLTGSTTVTETLPDGSSVDASSQLDGVDLTPHLTGANSTRPHETLYWRYTPQWAIRHGDMKLVVATGGSGQPELYDLARDAAEARDVAAQNPGMVAKLSRLLREQHVTSDQFPIRALDGVGSP